MDERSELVVALVEDERGYRDALRLLIDGTPGFRCGAAFDSIEQALREQISMVPNVILLDIGLPGMEGCDGVSLLQERFPDAAILMLTVFEDEEKVFRSLCNGAAGYVLKKTPPARLLEYVGDAGSGGSPMSPEIARKVIRVFTAGPSPIKVDCQLTAQESKLLGLLAEGHSYQGAADVFGVSINTIRNYVRSIYDKLHVHSKSEAVSKALRAGLI